MDEAAAKQAKPRQEFPIESPQPAKGAYSAPTYKPLIKFIGKRRNASHKKPISQTTHDSAALNDNDDFPNFGRPAILDIEVDAINTGGASLV